MAANGARRSGVGLKTEAARQFSDGDTGKRPKIIRLGCAMRRLDNSKPRPQALSSTRCPDDIDLHPSRESDRWCAYFDEKHGVINCRRHTAMGEKSSSEVSVARGSLAEVGLGTRRVRHGPLAHYDGFLFDRVGDDVMLVELIKP